MKTAVGAATPDPTPEEILEAIAEMTIDELRLLMEGLVELLERKRRERDA